MAENKFKGREFYQLGFDFKKSALCGFPWIFGYDIYR